MTGLDSIRRSPDRSGVFLDFDGSLSEIVSRPELAEPVAGVPEVLRALADTYAVVAVVSGRPSAEIRARLDVPGLVVLGLYGLEGPGAGSPNDHDALLAAVRRCVNDVPGARLEDKGRSVAVHVRGAADPSAAAEHLEACLGDVARRLGRVILPGKMVLELAPAETPGKGALVLAEARARGLAACLYAGDDQADADAFAALDRLAREGAATVRVGVAGPETPVELLAAADVVVDGPGGLVALLRDLLPPG